MSKSKSRRFRYTGRKTNEISFPLGGIGTGCIGLGGNGRLIDWEIFNRPSKGSFNGFSHFAIKAEQEGKVLDARVLNGDLHPPYTGQLNAAAYGSFGFGPPRQTMAGMPHFRSVTFQGPFPIATLTFRDPGFPGQVKLTAFNPFIPLNDRDSGIPAAFFEFEVRNPTDAPITYTLAGTLTNPLPERNLNRIRQEDGAAFLVLESDGVAPEETKYGNLTLATDAEDVSGQEFWYRGGWNDNLEVYWRDFTAPGRLSNRSYAPEQAGRDNHGTLAAHVSVPPRGRARVRFVVSWSFPNCENTWKPNACQCARDAGVAPTWKNYYATLWEDSRESAAYALAEWPRLFGETKRFRDAVLASDLPAAALDAVTANLAVLKTPTVLRLEDGTFYGWEGCHPSSGCCEGSCTHVWNYAQALPFLFPKLERSMREADYRYNLRPDGGMPFRIQLPLGTPPSGFRPCADGQFGGVMKAYRDWKVCGDTEWLRRLWPAIKASVEFAWHPGNPDRWDPEQTGVLWGRQHHTLDMELFGPNAWLTGFYLGALKAAAEMADALDDPETASRYRTLFAKGKAWTDAHLFNGEYYQQQVDLADRGIAESFDALNYWSEEHGELKYQVDQGCGIDQVLAQWHADLYGLGEIFDPGQTRSALEAIFRHNFKKPIRDFYNPWRIFCINDEGGLVMCDYPEGRRKPRIPLTYTQETMHGFEYAAAILMVRRGLVEEGLKVVEAVRERYDGEKRNPWNEIECGSNYARSMASYALLNVFSGFEFDLADGHVGFRPLRAEEGCFRSFWSLDSGWGEVLFRPGAAELRVLYGSLSLRSLRLPFVPASIEVAGQPVAFTVRDGVLHFEEPVALGERRSLHAKGA